MYSKTNRIQATPDCPRLLACLLANCRYFLQLSSLQVNYSNVIYGVWAPVFGTIHYAALTLE